MGLPIWTERRKTIRAKRFGLILLEFRCIISALYHFQLSPPPSLSLSLVQRGDRKNRSIVASNRRIRRRLLFDRILANRINCAPFYFFNLLSTSTARTDSFQVYIFISSSLRRVRVTRIILRFRFKRRSLYNLLSFIEFTSFHAYFEISSPRRSISCERRQKIDRSLSDERSDTFGIMIRVLKERKEGRKSTIRKFLSLFFFF